MCVESLGLIQVSACARGCQRRLSSWPISAEGFFAERRADAHIVTAQLIAEKTAELGEQVMFSEVGLADAFGSIRYPNNGTPCVR